MLIISGIIIVIVFLFGFVLLFGAPYLPSHRAQANIALDLLSLKKGQNFYGTWFVVMARVLLLAAKRGHKCVGYELNPMLYVIARIITWRKRDVIEVKTR